MSQQTVVALIGAGGIAEAHLPALLASGVRVVVWSFEGAAELVERHGGEVAASFDEAVDLANIVDIVTPTFTHCEVASRVLRAGKDIILEKPIGLTLDEIETLRRIAAEEGRRIFPAHVVRYFAEYERLHQAVADGLIGDVAVSRFVRSGPFPARASWFGDRELSGGIIFDLMIHDIDIARWVAGEVAQVSAVTSRIDSGDEVHEAAHVLLTHESGAISHIAGLWGAPHIDFKTEFSVTGTKGVLTHESLAQLDTVSNLEPTDRLSAIVPTPDSGKSPFATELRDFIAASLTGAQSRVTFEDGARAVTIALAAVESTVTQRPVPVKPVEGTFA